MIQDETSARPVKFNAKQARNWLKEDAEGFIEFMLTEELDHPVPAFHIDLFNLMVGLDVKRLACAIPRDHAKTTLAKLAVVHYFLYSKYSFIAYVSNTATISVEACRDIINYIETPNFEAVFGKAIFEVKQDGKGFYIFTIGQKTCILRAYGAGQQIRGTNIRNKRPQLAIVDDLEDNDNIADEELFLKLKRWFYGPFRKALDKFDNKIIHLGNMIANRCLLKEHIDSEYWYSTRYGCLLEGGVPLWPDAYPIEKLKLEFQEYMENGMIHIWFAEMMNLPMAAGMGVIQPEKIEYRPAINPGDAEFGFITTDLAVSSETWANKTAVVVHMFIDGVWQIVECVHERGMDPVDLFHTVVNLSKKWGVSVIGIENAAMQASLQHVFSYLLLLEGITGIEFVLLQAQARKMERILGWSTLLKKKEWVLTEGDFEITEQLLLIDPSSKDNDDDLVDACAYGPQMTERYLPLIMATLPDRPKVLNQVSSGQMCKV